MTDILIQFHAMPEETCRLVASVAIENTLHVAAVRYFPYRVSQVDPQSILSACQTGDFPDRLVLTVSPPDLNVTENLELYERNVGCLIIDNGALSNGELRESALSARSNDPTQLKMWRRISSRLKSMSSSGVFVINPTTRAYASSKNHRFTEGAAAFHRSGGILRPIGGNYIVLDDPGANKEHGK